MPIIKRKPFFSQYVYVDKDGRLNVKVPPDCLRWDDEFRLRLSKFWIKPYQIIKKSTFVDNYVNNGWSDKKYNVNGRKLRIYYLVSDLRSPPNSIMINATVVEDIDKGKGIEVTHSEFPMRNLQVYELVTDKIIGGVPTAKVVKNAETKALK